MRIMKKSLLYIAVGLLATASVVAAHQNPPGFEGGAVPAVHFPPGLEPTIDGDLSEWAPIDRDIFALTNDHIRAIEGFGGIADAYGNADASDISVEFLYGWSDAQNKIYYGYRVFDDYHSALRDDPGEWWWDDAMETMLMINQLTRDEMRDLSDSGEKHNFSFNYTLPPIGGGPNAGLGWMFSGLCIRCDWVNDQTSAALDGYYEVQHTFEGSEHGESTYWYELQTSPFLFSDTSIESPQSPSEWVTDDLDVNQVIHITQTFVDADCTIICGSPGDNSENDFLDGGYWTTTAGTGASSFGEVDIVLEPIDNSIPWPDAMTAVEAKSWGRIKAQF